MFVLKWIHSSPKIQAFNYEPCRCGDGAWKLTHTGCARNGVSVTCRHHSRCDELSVAWKQDKEKGSRRTGKKWCKGHEVAEARLL
jgi:hypothetical protein